MAREFKINFALLANLSSSFTSAFGSASSKMADLNTKATKLRADMDKVGRMYDHGALSANEYARSLSRLGNELTKVEARQRQMSAAMKWQGRAESLRSGGRQMAVQAFETGILLGAPVKAAIEFETAMLGVAKQVDGARDDAGNLTGVYYEMESQVKRLSKTIPLATNDIADMFAAGARMGVAKDELAGFVEQAAKMATAFEMPAGEIATSMGKIANVVGLPINRINELADTINYLDDNALSQGKDIIGVMLRIGGTAKQTGLSFQEAAALGSTLLSLGKTEETAGTAANAIMRELSIANMQPKRFQEGLAMIGMQAEAVQSGMANNAQETILQVLEAIGKLDKEVQVEATTRLFGEQFGDEAALLAGSLGEYRRQLALVNDEKRKGSMDREFQARMKTTAAQLQIAKNAAMETAIAFGSVLLPGIIKLAQQLGAFAEKVTAFAAEYPRLTEVLSYGTAIILGATVALGALAYVGGIIVSPFMQLWAWISKIGLMSKLTPILGLITIKFVLIAAAIAAVVAAGVWLYNNWDMVKAKAVETWGAITQWVSSTCEGIVTWFAAIPARISSAWESIKAGAASAWGTLVAWVSGAVSTIAAWAAELPGRIAYAIGFIIGLYLSLPGKAWTALSDMYNAFATWLPQAFNTAVTWLSNTVTSVGTYLSNIPGAALTAFLSLYDAVSTWAQSAYNSAMLWLGQMAVQAGFYLMELPGKAIEGMMGLYDAVSTWAQSAYNSVVDWVMKIPDVIADAFGRAAASVGSFFSNVAGKLSAGFSAGGGSVDVASNAAGGIYGRGAFLTSFAEDSAEAAIPLDGSPRAVSLWQQAGQMLGVGGGSGGSVFNITFAPTINGGGDAGEIGQMLKQERDAFMDQFQSFARQERRLSYE